MRQFMSKYKVKLLLVVVLLLLIILPLFVQNNYLSSVLTSCLLFSCFGMAWNIIGGYGGQISWCHAAFVTIGAYTNFIMYNKLGLSPFISLPVGAAISYVFATILGTATFRYRGPLFAITAIAFSEMLKIVLIVWRDLTNGASGLYMTYRGVNPWNWQFASDKPLYYGMIVLTAIILFISYKFIKSKTGYYLSTIKGDEDAAKSLGIDTRKTKLKAFQLSAVITSVVGAVYASYMAFIEPFTICGMDLSIKIGAVVIIGGIGTLYGPIIGAFVVIPLIELASTLLGAQGGTQVLYGLMLIIIVILRPSGLIGLFDRKTKLANAKQMKSSAAPKAERSKT